MLITFCRSPKNITPVCLTDLQACSEGLPLSKELGHTFRRLTAAWTKVITNDEVPRVTPPRTRNVQAVAAPARSRGLMLGPELSSFSRVLSEMHAELVRHSQHNLTASVCLFLVPYIALSRHSACTVLERPSFSSAGSFARTGTGLHKLEWCSARAADNNECSMEGTSFRGLFQCKHPGYLPAGGPGRAGHSQRPAARQCAGSIRDKVVLQASTHPL